MKKRYTLSAAIIDHIFKEHEINNGSGGHSTAMMGGIFQDYRIIAIPSHRQNEAANWLYSSPSRPAIDVAKACSFVHIATFIWGNVTYTNKSMFPGNLNTADLIKTIERALSAPIRGHTYNSKSTRNASSGGYNSKGGVKQETIPVDEFRRRLTNEGWQPPAGINGSYVRGRANGITVLGQLTGGGGDLTSVYPCTYGFYS